MSRREPPSAVEHPPSGTAAEARVIVCERTGWWALALRRELGPARARVEEVRSLSACGAVLGRAPRSLAVVELSAANADAVLSWLAAQPRAYPLARTAVVAERDLAWCEELAREAGAVAVATSPRRLGDLAEVAARHLASVTDRVQLAAAVWASLPWEAAASGGRPPA